MSLEHAEKFVMNCCKNPDGDLKNILTNVNSNFESTQAKFFYISEKAKEFGYEFTPEEISKAIFNVKNKLKNSQLVEFSKENNLTNNNEPGENVKKILYSLW